jgi:hypothetical protein
MQNSYRIAPERKSIKFLAVALTQVIGKTQKKKVCIDLTFWLKILCSEKGQHKLMVLQESCCRFTVMPPQRFCRCQF